MYTLIDVDNDLSLTLDPLPSNGTGEYHAFRNKTFCVTCTVTSKDPNVFVLWQRKDGKVD